jgi:hypothetical protein
VCYFYSQVPIRLKAAAGRHHVKRSLGTRCPQQAKAIWPAEIARWEAQIAAWERQARREHISRDRARELASQWAANIAAGAPLTAEGKTATSSSRSIWKSSARRIG